MLRSIKKLEHFRILGTDAEVGSVTDTYFDDEQWVVRYLIVEAGDWLHERKVLISPYAVKTFDWRTRAIVTNLSRIQIERSPRIDTAKPVSRQHESEYYRYYGYAEYWPSSTYWAWGAVPIARPASEFRAAERQQTTEVPERRGDEHLRSSRHVIGYHIEASDAAIGHIEDFLFDDETWAIRYAVVDTRNWLPGKLVLISPERISNVNWAERSVVVDMRREAVRNSPTYDPAVDLETHIMPKDIFPQTTPALAATRKRLAPAIHDAFTSFSEGVFAKGALSTKTKQLIAVAAAHITQCPYCIRGHTKAALRNGASPEEIMEAIWVAVEMRAGAAYAHSALALDAIDEATSKQGA